MNPATVSLIERLGIALIHSLWQGSLVGIGLLTALVALRRARSQVRYLTCCLALIVTLLLPIGTFLAVSADGRATNQHSSDERSSRDSAFVVSAATALEAAVSLLPVEPLSGTSEPPLSYNGEEEHVAAARGENDAQTMGLRDFRWLSPHAEQLLLAIVAAWSVGVFVLSCRLLGGYVVARGLTRRLVAPLDDAWQARVKTLAARLGVRTSIELWQSASIEVPAVLGCFRPVILVPVEILTGLSVAQVEAILAHELAHVARYDFLVNAVQCVIETLLFYHPCVWWISARIRAEREHCCDELAVMACGDSLVFARALTRLEELRPPARLAVALTSGGTLLGRIRRIVGQPRAGDVIGGWLTGTLAIALPLAVGGTWAWGRAENEKPAANATVAEGRADKKAISRAAAENAAKTIDTVDAKDRSHDAPWRVTDELF
jgi:bla regulator protein BlaR1